MFVFHTTPIHIYNLEIESIGHQFCLHSEINVLYVFFITTPKNRFKMISWAEFFIGSNKAQRNLCYKEVIKFNEENYDKWEIFCVEFYANDWLSPHFSHFHDLWLIRSLRMLYGHNKCPFIAMRHIISVKLRCTTWA